MELHPNSKMDEPGRFPRGQAITDHFRLHVQVESASHDHWR
jgi:hypothetical protein